MLDFYQMCKEIVNCIVDTASQLMFSDSNEKTSIWNAFYNKIELLYSSNRILFDNVSKKILSEQLQYFEQEDVKIQMECAGIWRKSAIDIYIFRIRYYLSLSNEEDWICLKNKVNSLFIFKSAETSLDVFEDRKNYLHFMLSIMNSNETYIVSLKEQLTSFSISSYPADAEGTIIYVLLQSILKNEKNIPSYIKNVFYIITDMSHIEIDGLIFWSDQQKITHYKKLIKAFRAINYHECANIIEEYYQFLLSLMRAYGIDYVDLLSNILQEHQEIITSFETKLYNAFDMNSFLKNAHNYLRQNSIDTIV